MIKRIEEWKERIAQLKKSGSSSMHKFAYAETVLEQVESFFEVGNTAIAERILSRLDTWSDKHSSIMLKKDKQKQPKPFANTFSTEFFQKDFKNLTRFFVQKQQYIPKPDKEYISKALADVKTRIESNAYGDLIQDELKEIKKRLFDRLHRSLRAQFSASVFMRPFAKIDNQVGPYNNANNLSEVCKLISERDAIWIDDLIQLYGSLYKLEEKITNKRK